MAYTFRFQWDMGEYIRAARAVTRHLQGNRFRIVFGVLPVLASIALAAAVISPSEGRLERLAAIVPWLLVLGLWFLFLLWGVPYLNAWQFKRHDPSAKTEMFRVIENEGIQSGTGLSRVALKWEGIGRVIETPEFFLFYYNPRCAHYLPKRTIAGPEELEAVRDFIRTKVAERAVLLATGTPAGNP
jgi:hypothetical protein